jgi:ribosomal protein L7/L12
MKAIVKLTGLSAAAAEDLLSRAPALILSGVTKDVADATKRTLEAQGADVKVSLRRG